MSMVYFQTTLSFKYGIVIPYLVSSAMLCQLASNIYIYKVLLLIAIYFSLHIVSVAITQTKNRSAVAPAPEK